MPNSSNQQIPSAPQFKERRKITLPIRCFHADQNASKQDNMGSRQVRQVPHNEVAKTITHSSISESSSGFHVFEIHAPSMGTGIFMILIIMAICVCLFRLCKHYISLRNRGHSVYPYPRGQFEVPAITYEPSFRDLGRDVERGRRRNSGSQTTPTEEIRGRL